MNWPELGWLHFCAQYIDYVGSWGPAIVGHAHPEVTAALAEQIKKVCPFGFECRSIIMHVVVFLSAARIPVHLCARGCLSVTASHSLFHSPGQGGILACTRGLTRRA